MGTNPQPPSSTYFPTVLIVEDDPSMNTYIRERFHDETCVGVITAQSLTQAKNLVDSSEIPISAVIADLFFEGSKSDPKQNLTDGLDFLAYCKNRRPAVTQYIFSVFSERDQERKKAEDLALPIRTWFQKIWYRKGAGAVAPWATIERDLLQERIDQDNTLTDRLEQLKLERPNTKVVSEVVRGAIRLPVRTYIQSLSGYRVLKPIEVICTCHESDGRIRAHATQLALVGDALGETVDEALSELGERLIAAHENLSPHGADALHDYLRGFRQVLHEHVQRDDEGNDRYSTARTR